MKRNISMDEDGTLTHKTFAVVAAVVLLGMGLALAGINNINPRTELPKPKVGEGQSVPVIGAKVNPF